MCFPSFRTVLLRFFAFSAPKISDSAITAKRISGYSKPLDARPYITAICPSESVCCMFSVQNAGIPASERPCASRCALVCDPDSTITRYPFFRYRVRSFVSMSKLLL